MHISLGIRHALMALLAVVLTGAAALGFLGPAVGPERIAHYDVAAVVREDRTVLVREVIDWDFGNSSRRGIIRKIPTDGGVPEDIEVSSPTAPDDVDIDHNGYEVAVRIGRPDQTITGRHRYVITYVLPETVVEQRFALDAIGAFFDVPISEGHIEVLGAELGGVECFIGSAQSTDRCDATTADGSTVVEVSDLDAYQGVTVAGDVARTQPADLPEIPPAVPRDGNARVMWAAVVAVLSLITGLASFLVSRHLGRNEVAAGGATAAAFDGYGEEKFGPEHPVPIEPPSTRLVADDRMAELAGIEFVPPAGVEPWQAAVVLREKIDSDTVSAWFSSQAARDVITFEPSGSGVKMRPGPKSAEADAAAAPILNQAFGHRSEVDLGSYDSRFSQAWKEAGQSIDGWVWSAAVFRRRPPTFQRTTFNGSPAMCLIPAMMLVFSGGGSAILGASVGLRSAFAAIAIAIGLTALVGFVAYRPLTRALTARGSALLLRTESFRRFLHGSEARHVEWAWEQGLLRDYSAWAVALGEVDAWNGALSASSLPPEAVASTGPILAPSIYHSSLTSATTPPQSTSGGGGGFSGGGFSGGGSVGGGGGGGGGSSW